MVESLTPEVFDALIVVNLVIGVFLAGRRFLRDIRGPLPEDAPYWAREANRAARENPAPRDA
ncbi:MAG: hypothetical protein OXI77_14810 [Chloroflexota bacterium]|nr:hypothetical protein [Chloroflexota bacterium]MDE2909326.1 hypothetical protein [Chloroflexota bacterium]